MMIDRAELARIHYVTAHFEVLQGLVALPLIGWIAVSMAWAEGWLAGWVVPVAAVPAAGAAIAAVAYYRRSYGQVRPRHGKTGSGGIGWLVVGIVTAGLLVRALVPDLPVSPAGLVLFAGALVLARVRRPLAPPLLLVGGAGVVLSLVPLGGADGPHPLSDIEIWILALCAAEAAVAVWGHLLIRRALGGR